MPVQNSFNPINTEELKYYNEYGGFSEDGKEYIIKLNNKNKLPTVWSHVIANEKFGTLVTESMGGFTYSENSRLNRLTSWSNNPVQDVPSEIIYIKDKTLNKFWSVGSNPISDDSDYYIKFGAGYANYSHMNYGILQELDVFVAKEESAKINILKLKNTMPEKRTLKLLYYIKPVLR